MSYNGDNYISMEIRRCFEILELDENATFDDAKQSYKDLVNIWHPDRFSGNPRLKQKSEGKLKDINIAYETITPFLLSGKSTIRQSPSESQARDEAETGIKTNAARENRFDKPEAETTEKNKTEAFVETGTEIILDLFSTLYTNFRRIVSDVKSEIDKPPLDQRPKNDIIRGKGRKGGQGRAKGMGKRGGGRRGGRN